jgi:hypothetical protein
MATAVSTRRYDVCLRRARLRTFSKWRRPESPEAAEATLDSSHMVWHPGIQRRAKMTTKYRLFFSACAMAALSWFTIAGILAQQDLPDRPTTFTFSAPVELPGVTLPAGTYQFRIANPTTEADIVRVFTSDGTKVLAQFYTMPAERTQASSSPEVRFMETPVGVPLAVKTWWYPDERQGVEFIYPKDAARRLAKGNSQPVLTTQAESTTVAQTKGVGLARLSSSGEAAVKAGENPLASTPSGGRQQGETVSSSGKSEPPSR